MNKIRSIQPESLRLSHYSDSCALCPPCHAGCTHPDRSAPHADRQPQAASHKARLAALHSICWHIFRHITQKLLAIRKYSCVVSMQPDEKFPSASAAQALCGVSLSLRFHICGRLYTGFSTACAEFCRKGLRFLGNATPSTAIPQSREKPPIEFDCIPKKSML